MKKGVREFLLAYSTLLRLLPSDPDLVQAVIFYKVPDALYKQLYLMSSILEKCNYETIFYCNSILVPIATITVCYRKKPLGEKEMKREQVASCYIFSDDRKVLLIYHKKMKKWLPPGGHLEENELPHEAAIREVFEETGLEIDLNSAIPIRINEWNAISIPTPTLMLLENIPECNGVPAHQHIDHIYTTLYNKKNREEKIGTEKACWFSKNEMMALEDEVAMFAETKQLLSWLFGMISDLV